MIAKNPSFFCFSIIIPTFYYWKRGSEIPMVGLSYKIFSGKAGN